MTDFEQFRKQPLHGVLDYAHMLRKLLPPGKLWGFVLPADDDVVYDSAGNYEIWDDDPSSANVINDYNASSGTDNSSLLGKLMMVAAGEFARLEERQFDLVNESVPGLSVELLENYKEQYVRDATEEALINTDEDLQRFAHSKEYDLAVPFTAENAEALGLTLGFVINVLEGSTEATPLICGVGKCGLERCASRGVFSTVVIEVISGTANYELMQDIFENAKPGHIVLVWDDQR